SAAATGASTAASGGGSASANAVASSSGSGGGAPTCPSPVGIDDKAGDRTACAFTAGATPASTLAITAAEQQQLPIKHVIVMMKENRSYDGYFGNLSKLGQPDAEPLPDAFSNPDKQ